MANPSRSQSKRCCLQMLSWALQIITVFQLEMVYIVDQIM